MRSFSSWLFAAAALAAPWPAAGSPATGAGSPAPVVLWSSGAYVSAVLEASPEVGAARENLFALERGVDAQFARTYFPTLGFTAAVEPAKLAAGNRFTFEAWRPPSNDLTLSPSLSWNLFNSFKDELSLRSSRLGRDSTRQSLEITLQSRALSALRGYYGLLLRRKLLEVAEKNRAAQDEQYRLTQDRYKHGMKSLSDLLKTETDLRSSEISLESAVAERRLRQFAFNDLLGQADEKESAFPEGLTLGATTAPLLEAGLRSALLNRPELRKNRLELAKADASYKRAVLAAVPSLALDFDLTNAFADSYGKTAPTWGLNTAVYGLALKLSLPGSFNFYSQVQEVRAARASWRVSRHDHEALLRQVRQEVYEAQIGLARALRSFEIALRKEEISHQNLDIVLEQYSQGSADVIKLSQAQLDYVEAQTERMRAFHDANINDAEYRRAIGVPLWR